MNRVSQENRRNKTPTRHKVPAREKPKLQVWTNDALDGPNYGTKNLLGRLEAENAELRRKAIVLVLQVQALRDGDQALTA
jgi:hypothetical protein